MGRQADRFRDRRGRGMTAARELTPDERAALEQAVQDILAPRPRVGCGRLATKDEAIVAAWANLAVEEPGLSLDHVRRLIVERS